jgi:hypothetical protein
MAKRKRTKQSVSFNQCINGNGKFESAVANFKTMVGRVRVDITTRIDSFQKKNYKLSILFNIWVQSDLYLVTQHFCGQNGHISEDFLN